MAFTLIKGTFHVVGYQPDGDSIRFKADRPENWALLGGPPVELKSNGHVQLRIEAIDTLETHCAGHHQPLELARPALDFLLAELGIQEVEFNETGIRCISAQDGARGYILARKAERYGRPVAFVFAGDAEEADGTKYMGHGGTIEGFKGYLALHPDPVLVLPSCHFTNLDTFVELDGDQVRLTIEPENLVFLET